MTRADYRNLRADQKNNDIVASQMASWDELRAELNHLQALSREFRTGFAAGYAQAYADAWHQANSRPSSLPLTRTKDEHLTRKKGE